MTWSLVGLTGKMPVSIKNFEAVGVSYPGFLTDIEACFDDHRYRWPLGAGKSTVSKAVARRLDFSCLDTGAMYRCAAWKALDEGVSLDDAEALARIAHDNDIAFTHEAGDPLPRRVGPLPAPTSPTPSARRKRTAPVSPVAAVPAVRAALVAQQQRIGRAGNYVVEGRDIGTAVFPEAELKVFLTASAAERSSSRGAKRVPRRGLHTDYDVVLADIVRRDEIDSSRDVPAR